MTSSSCVEGRCVNPGILSLPDLIFDRAENYPDKVFLQDTCDVTETFRQTLRSTTRWLNTLEHLSVSSGSRVAVMIPPSITSCHLWAAVSWLGAWEVPINPDFRGESLVHILNDTKCVLLITVANALPQILAVKERLIYLEHVIILGRHAAKADNVHFCLHGDEVISDRDENFRTPPRLKAADISTILYTSGTTGRSKGCLIPWGLWRWGVGLYRYSSDGSDCHYSPYPMNHLSGKMVLYNMAMLKGRAVIRDRLHIEHFWRDIRKYGCTNALLMGSTATLLLKEAARPDDIDNPLKNIGLAPVPPGFRQFENRFGVKVATGYGSTETAWPIVSGSGDLTDHQTCGQLRSPFEARIVNELGQDTEVGEIGELLVRCTVPDSMLIEYLNRPEDTKKAWYGGWFHTGDAFKVDESGNYYFVDRMKDAIRRRGENISSFEVEHYVKMYPAVMDCAAVGISDDEREEEILVVLTVREGSDFLPEHLIEYLEPIMPKFMLPRYVRTVDSLPMTHTNKIRKIELRKAGIVNSETWDRKNAVKTLS